MTKYIKLTILLILTAAIITACGNGDNNDTNDTTDNNQPAPDQIILNYEPEPEPEPEPNPLFLNTDPINLAIRTPDEYIALIWAVEEEMRELFAEHGIDFSVTITDYDMWAGGQVYQNSLLQAELAAGTSYDIVFLNHLPLNLRPFADNGLLLNIYDLIDQDPSRTRDDFFTNVLTALEHQGGLYMLPLTFGFAFMGINANLPDSIVDDFMQKSSISWRQAMQIAATLQNEYPEIYADFPYISNLIEFHVPTTLLQRVVASFIDFNTAESFFDGAEFVEFANLMQATISPPENFQDTLQEVIFLNFESPNIMQQMTERHIFLGAARRSAHPTGGGLNFTPLIPLFGLADDTFLNFVPTSDDNGNLLVDISSYTPHTVANVVFPAGDNGAVAWEFTMRFLQRMLTLGRFELMSGVGNTDFVIPILRSELEPHFNRVMEQYSELSWWSADFVTLSDLDFATVASVEEIIANSANALARLTELANRPVAFADRTPFIVWWDGDIVELFMAGEISAEELGQQAQERTALWLAGDWEN